MRISAVIPTFQREQVLLNTIDALINLKEVPDEVLIVDQSISHDEQTNHQLEKLDQAGKIRWIRLAEPSITHAMNVGLELASNELVLFLDDDIVPERDLIGAHLRAHEHSEYNIVAGQVLQPGEEQVTLTDQNSEFRFCSDRSREISELMGGNFSIKRSLALRLGGFDENFVHVAYRFEAEFANRALNAGEKILFEPSASIRHLKASKGGTRSYGEHLRTVRPSHAVGAYYYLLRARQIRHRFMQIVGRPLRAIRTKHHLSKPWWIPATLLAEALGLCWAISLVLRGPRFIKKA